LVVVQGHDHPLTQTFWVKTGSMHWLIDLPGSPFNATVKLRYRQLDQPCRVEPQADGSMELYFESPQRAVTPGQFAVLYQGTRCLGGAVIESL
jgi:tRNA-specific 2-thiouridylase